MSEYTANVDALGTLRLLNALRSCGLDQTCRFYQASTSELYGKVQEIPQTENTPFYPRSPYAVAKQYAFWQIINYREAYNMYAVNGILFNHESPRRGPTFVTRKITRAVARIARGLQSCLFLGNLEAKRDWGHARDFVEGMYLMLQQDNPDDFVLATGETHTVREFVEQAFSHIGIILRWEGTGVDEIGYEILDDNTTVTNTNVGTNDIAVISPSSSSSSTASTITPTKRRTLVAIDPAYFRPTEVDLLLGNATKAQKLLGWKPRITFMSLVKEMVAADLALVDKGDFTS